MHRLLFILAGLVLGPASLLASVVINEIMYRSDLVVPESTEEEFIELFNSGVLSVDLSGWQFVRGLQFQFPPGTQIPANGYLVVAADPTTFQTKYPSVPANQIVGGWAGRLSNSGETVELANALGVVQDTVRYADRGNGWAARTRGPLIGGYRGWEWTAAHDGGGHSLELRNASLTNECGYNWSSSVSMDGTPGAANSVASTNGPPLICDLDHLPEIPSSSESVTVLAEIVDEQLATVTAQLWWRTNQASPFQSVAMADDGAHGDGAAGDGVFGGSIPAQANLTIVEFYVQATDAGSQSQTCPSPTVPSAIQETNALYQVDNSFDPTIFDQPGGSHPRYRTIMTATEAAELVQIGVDSIGSEIKINASMNTTFISADVKGVRVRYNCDMRLRGNGSREDEVKSYKIRFPRSWDGLSSINLNASDSWRQALGLFLVQKMGGICPDALRINLTVNGQDLTGGPATESNYGSYVQVEARDGAMVSNHWGDDDDGNLYKVEDDFTYKGENPADYIGFQKQTNASVGDWSDVITLARTFDPTQTPDPQFATEVGNIVDIENWIRYFAINALLANTESSLVKSGDEDFMFYRGVLNPRFYGVFWDMDSVLDTGDAVEIGLFHRIGESPPSVRFINHPPHLSRFYEVLLELINTCFEEVTYDAFIDQVAGDWMPASAIAEAKDFRDLRVAHVMGLIPAGSSTYTPPTLAASSYAFTPIGDVQLSEVIASNQAAFAVSGQFPDLIELVNVGASAADLTGMRLSDDLLNQSKYVFPPGSTIAPGATLVVHAADILDGLPGLVTNFKINAFGGSVSLYDAAGNLVDQVLHGPQITDLSISRLPGSDTWDLTSPTPNAPNGGALSQGAVTNLVINEWAAEGGFYANDDFLELYNQDVLPVPMGGFGLSDEFAFPHRQLFPPLSFIAGQSYLAFEADGDPEKGPDHIDFAIASQREFLGLFDSAGHGIDWHLSGYLQDDKSEGRLPDGAGAVAPLPIPTPAGPNSLTVSDQALISSLRLSELSYHPVGNEPFEYLELQNIGATPLDVTGVRIDDGVTFTFPSLILPPNGITVVVQAAGLAEFQAIFPDISIAGAFSKSLSNGGEEIAVLLPETNTSILRFHYDDGWYPATDGAGPTMTVVDVLADPRLLNLPTGWQQSAGAYGSPGTAVAVAPLMSIAFDKLDVMEPVDTATGIVTRRLGFGPRTISLLPNGTATATFDYSPFLGLAVFGPYASTSTFLVNVLDDTDPEGDETLAVNLLAGADYTLGTSLATLTFVDDDLPETNKVSIVSPLDDISMDAAVGLWLQGAFPNNGTSTWSAVQTPVGGTASFENVAQQRTGVQFDLPGDYRLRLSVTQGGVTTHADTTVHVVNGAGTLHTIDAGTYAPTSGTSQALLGSLSGPALSNEVLHWSQDVGPTKVGFSDPNGLTSLASPLLPGTYQVRLNLTDASKSLFDTAPLVVTGSTPVTYADWAPAYAVTNPDEDDDGDSLKALYEYGVNTHPVEGREDAQSGASGLLTELATAAAFDLPDPLRDDVHYHIAYTPDLQSTLWDNVASHLAGSGSWTGSATVSSRPLSPGRQRVSILVSGGARGFYQLIIELP